MNSIIAILLAFFLSTACGVAYFSSLDPHKQQLVKNWIGDYGNANPDSPNAPGTTAQAPEIDAASGTSAITLLMGVLLLAGERSRTRRS